METYCVSYQGSVLDILNSTDRTSSARRAMHAAGIELNYALFIGMTAQADALVVGIIFRALDYLKHGIEGVGSARQQPVSRIEIVVAVSGADDDW
jgi:hypothetical protein